MVDTDAVDRWLSAYLKAWRTDAREDIAALFEPDARYFTAPYREPYCGPEAIADWWIGNGDSAVPWTFEYRVLAGEGPLYVVRGVTTYAEGVENPGAADVYDNVWLVTLAASGRASEFVEYWMLREAPVRGDLEEGHD